jgi:hypothetical protein
MSFCVKCSAHEATIELLTKKHHEELQKLNAQLSVLENEVSKLSFDLAFYEGKIINLSCNNK